MSDTNVAQDELKAFVRRIERVEDEINALNADKSEIYKEAKSSGFDVKQLRKVVQKRRLPAEERMEQDTVFDLYWDAVHAPEKSSAHARVENIEEFPAKTTVAALRSNPDLAIVEAANLERKHETQSAPQAARDLTSPHAPQGQVAPHSESGTPPSNEAPMAVYGDSVEDATAPLSESVDILPGGEMAEELDGADHHPAATNQAGNGSEDAPKADTVKSVEPSAGSAAPAVVYPAPGVVVWESTPPEGVERHAYSQAFGDLGQDSVVIADDIARAKAAPIVKIGKVILDGWARYMTARSSVGLDGKSAEYQVVQYDGADPLLDCIRWNIAGRILSDREKQIVINRLSILHPQRKREIYNAVTEWVE